MAKKKLPVIELTGNESLAALCDIRTNVDGFIGGVNLEDYSSEELALLNAKLGTVRTAMAGKFKTTMVTINNALDKVLKKEQQARREADPDYDKKHQGIGTGK